MGLSQNAGKCQMCVILLLLSIVSEGASHTLSGRSDARVLIRREEATEYGPGNIAKMKQEEIRAVHRDQSTGKVQTAKHKATKTAAKEKGKSHAANKTAPAAKLPDQIPILAIESTEGAVFTLPGVPNKMARNLGLATRGRSRLELYTSWTRLHMAKDPNQLAIFVDGYNVVSGGCDDTELKERYEALLRAGGDSSQLLIGAEFSDRQFGGKESNMTLLFKATVASQRQAMLKAHKLKEDVYSDLVRCDGHPCKHKPTYEFIDLGFAMGPVGKLHAFFTGIMAHKIPSKSQMKLLNIALTQSHHTQLSDEEAAALYVLTKQNAMVLDYTGGMVLDLRGITKQSLFSIKHGKLVNNVLKKTQCFVRGDGSSHGWAEELAAELRG